MNNWTCPCGKAIDQLNGLCQDCIKAYQAEFDDYIRCPGYEELEGLCGKRIGKPSSYYTLTTNHSTGETILSLLTKDMLLCHGCLKLKMQAEGKNNGRQAGIPLGDNITKVKASDDTAIDRLGWIVDQFAY